jgi:sec-independent protein translocase protein TatA
MVLQGESMGSMSLVHWVAVLLVVVLVFGTKKLTTIGGDLGKAVKGFKDGVSGKEEKPDLEKVLPAPVAGITTLDVEVKERAGNRIGR